jgi:thiopeptide-type bacteriocin biosynthesis protein
MKHYSKSSAAKWLSFHIFLPGLFESFLVDYLLPELENDLKSGLIKRFFFIRYSEGGDHVRLRFLLGTSDDTIERRLTDMVHKFASETSYDSNGCRVEQHLYDRSELYFGETALSVYSELLNEQTSYLSLRLLRAQYEVSQRPLVVAAILNLILRGSVDSVEDFLMALTDSRRFAADTVANLGFPLQPVSEESEARLRTALLDFIPRAATTLGQDSTIQRIIRLLQRTRRCDPSGRLVVTHALHLLCNKLTGSIMEEYNLFSTLYHLEAETSDIRKGVDHGRMA